MLKLQLKFCSIIGLQSLDVSGYWPKVLAQIPPNAFENLRNLVVNSARYSDWVDYFDNWPATYNLTLFTLIHVAQAPANDDDAPQYYPLKNFVSKCPKLQHLKIGQVSVTQFQMEMIITDLRHLQTLDIIVDNAAIPKQDIVELFRRSAKALTYLDITGWKCLNINCVQDLFVNIPSLRELKAKSVARKGFPGRARSQRFYHHSLRTLMASTQYGLEYPLSECSELFRRF